MPHTESWLLSLHPLALGSSTAGPSIDLLGGILARLTVSPLAMSTNSVA